MTNTADVVALINKRDQDLAVWHVVIDPSWPMSRLCGAWVNTMAPHLYVQRYLLPFDDELPDELVHIGTASAGVFDANATRQAVIATIAELDARHKDSPTKAGKARAPIPWPQVPEPLDWATLPPVPNGVVDDQLRRETIAAAMWVGRLSDAWAKVEVNRLSRDYLSDAEPSPRPMPVVLVDAHKPISPEY